MTDSTETTYRYLTRVPGVQGGRPIIKGTRTPIRSIVGYYKLGLTVEEMLEGLPHLTAAQIYEALSYYHDHVDEIEQEIDENRVERVIERFGLRMGEGGRIEAGPKHAK
jgi:uncharacterized protein (DUF433 family)